MASLWAWLRVCGFFKLHMRNLTEQVAINPYTPKMELFACDYILTHTTFSTKIIPHGYSNQTTKASIFGCHLIHTGLDPYSRCRCWFCRRVGSCGSFGLCVTAPHGLRSDHQMLTYEPLPPGVMLGYWLSNPNLSEVTWSPVFSTELLWITLVLHPAPFFLKRSYQEQIASIDINPGFRAGESVDGWIVFNSCFKQCVILLNPHCLFTNSHHTKRNCLVNNTYQSNKTKCKTDFQKHLSMS